MRRLVTSMKPNWPKIVAKIARLHCQWNMLPKVICEKISVCSTQSMARKSTLIAIVIGDRVMNDTFFRYRKKYSAEIPYTAKTPAMVTQGSQSIP